MVSTKKQKTTEQAEEVQKPQETTLDVPSIDRNAALKIDEAEREEENVPLERRNRKLFTFGGIALVLIILGVIGFVFLFLQNLPAEKTVVVPMTQESITASPTPTLPVLVRSEWTFEVLNGSGVAGVAGKAADKLEALGYKVINTGNADRQTYKGNGLFVSQEMEGKVDLLVADLKGTIAIATVAGVLKDSAASARIIIGKE